MSDLLDTTQEYEFDAGAVDTIDQSSIEGGGPSYPLIQWVTGDVKAKKYGGMDYLGGFFVKADRLDVFVKSDDVDAVMAAAGWTKTTRTFANGTEEDGYWRRELAISIIAARKSWEIPADNASAKVFPWDSYDKAKAAADLVGKTAHGRNQYLVVVKGLEFSDPFVLTLKGMVGMAFEDFRSSNAVLSRFTATVIRAANDASDAAAKEAGKPAGKKWAYRAFWLPVGADRDAKGEPVYTEVGKKDSKRNVVLPIAVGLPDKPANVDLKRFYVGADMLTKVNDLFDQSAGWRTYLDTIRSTPEGNGATAEAPIDNAAAEAEAAALAATGL